MTAVTTIENRWDILYRDYPEVYDRFGSFPYEPDPVEYLIERLQPSGTVVDIGSGTGRSTFKLAERAVRVIGVEPERAMRAVAERKARERGITNVEFLAATKEAVPLPDGSVDAVVAVCGGEDVPEARRITRPGGLIASLGIAPDRYGGELVSVIGEPTPELEAGSRRLVEQGFSYEDFESVQEYATTENIVATYGFIFGGRAIAHLQRSGRTSIRWTFRLHWQRA